MSGGLRLAPKPEFWQYKVIDRSSVSIRFYDARNPHGVNGVRSFVDCVSHLAKERCPQPVDYFNVASSNHPLNDKRFVFGSPDDAYKFAAILQKVPLGMLYVHSFVFVDLVATRLRFDNESVRVLVSQEHEVQSSKVISQMTKGNGQNVNQGRFEECDPFAELLSRMKDPHRTPTRPEKQLPNHASLDESRPSAVKRANTGSQLSMTFDNVDSMTHASKGTVACSNQAALNDLLEKQQKEIDRLTSMHSQVPVVPPSASFLVSNQSTDNSEVNSNHVPVAPLTNVLIEGPKEITQDIPDWLSTINSEQDVAAAISSTRCRVESFFGTSAPSGQDLKSSILQLTGLKKTLGELEKFAEFLKIFSQDGISGELSINDKYAFYLRFK